MKGSKTSTYLLKKGRRGEMVRSTSWKGQEPAHTHWRWADKEKWSDQLHGRIKNKHIPPEDGEMIRSTSWKCQEKAHTSWRRADKEKWSGQLHERIKNKHIPPEKEQTRRNGQINFMKGLKTSTCPLKMGRQEEMVRSTSWKGHEQAHTCWRLEIVRSTSWKGQEQAHTFWRWRNGQVNFMEGSRTSTYLLKMKKWSGQLHRRVKNKHIPAEDGQTRRNGEINFMGGSKTSTYLLQMEKWSGQLHRRVENKHIPAEDGEMVRLTLWKGQKQAHTCCRWKNGQFNHGRVKNKHIPAENGDMVRSTSWKDQEQAHTHWRWADNEK